MVSSFRQNVTGNAAKTLNVSRSSWLVWTIAIVCSRESPTVSYRSFRKSTMLVPHSSQVFPKETLRNSPERTILAVLFFFFFWWHKMQTFSPVLYFRYCIHPTVLRWTCPDSHVIFYPSDCYRHYQFTILPCEKKYFGKRLFSHSIAVTWNNLPFSTCQSKTYLIRIIV